MGPKGRGPTYGVENRGKKYLRKLLFLIVVLKWKGARETSAAAVDPRYLKVEVTEYDFPSCSYVINRTCQNPMLIM